jgi:ferritin-like metal-binding protein YciE
MKNNSSVGFKTGTPEKENYTPMQSYRLMQLFEEELKDMFWAEKALTKAIPKMIKYATSIELMESLTTHLEETRLQVDRLVYVFSVIGIKPETNKCQTMEGLINETVEIMESCEVGSLCDAAIISSAKKIGMYEMASYGILQQFAETLGLDEVVMLLEATIQEEEDANDKLSALAMSGVNLETADIEA